jgi:HlyD family secretion protein
MATATLPDRRAARGSRRSLLIGVTLIIAAIATAFLLTRPATPAARPAGETSTVARGPIVASVSGSGSVAAAQSLDLAFQASGTVTSVLVAEGDRVTAGQALATIDSRDLELQVASAQAALDSATIRLAQVADGNVQPADIDAQAAAVASAQAQLRSAQAQLAALKNPTAAAVSSAETAVRQAELKLQAQRDNSSASKTRAEQDLHKAVDSLTQAQAQYATAKSNWEFVQGTGQDPTNPESKDSSGKTVKNKVSDTQRQQYYDSFVQAEAALHSAEAGVQQAQIAYDNARQAEPNNIQQAEATLADAQAQLAALKSPGKADIATSQAAVDQARASLEQAQANLARLTAPGTQTDIDIQRASVTQAEQTLIQARLALEHATLSAPFAGIVTAVNIVPGSSASSAAVAVSLIDRSALHVDLKLSENDVANVELGQPVDLTIDALKGWEAQGAVGYIAPAADSSNGVVTYRVRVDIAGDDPQIKVGMTANLLITTETKDAVLLVPNSALLPKGAGRVVQVPNPDGTTSEVEVQTGLSDGNSTEIISGLSEGQVVIAMPQVTAQPQTGGLFGG